jgi:hypothetical protein
MKILYIGQNNPGSTSSMRADVLKQLLQPDEFSLIDTFKPISGTSRPFRSFGFRTNFGPLITNVNNTIINNIHSHYDIIWVDKANFISPATTRFLRSHASVLVHFTPDSAFYSNKSHLFNSSLSYYDWFISSKSFEKEFYPVNKLILITQAFDKKTHRLLVPFDKKIRNVIFIGLYEPARENVIMYLINSGIRVTLGGIGWKNRKIIKHRNLEFIGDKIFGQAYVEAISSSLFSLGLLSKKFPELHTTRTFEIPACGTALITEQNPETSAFFNNNEVIFYDNFHEIPEKIKYYLNHTDELKILTIAGNNKVSNGTFDYQTILKNVLLKIGIFKR